MGCDFCGNKNASYEVNQGWREVGIFGSKTHACNKCFEEIVQPKRAIFELEIIAARKKLERGG